MQWPTVAQNRATRGLGGAKAGTGGEKRRSPPVAQTLAALLDLVQGFACESGTEALERYSRDPVGLMDRATGVLGKLKSLAGAAEPEEKK